MESNSNSEERMQSSPIWVKQARKRAESRTFTVPVDRRGRAILSFWVSQSPRPEVEDVVEV